MSIILGIETSCDETAVAILKDSNNILANIVSSQVSLHLKYGGVVPEIASRDHLNSIYHCLKLALDISGIKLSDIDSIGYANEPGLIASYWQSYCANFRNGFKKENNRDQPYYCA